MFKFFEYACIPNQSIIGLAQIGFYDTPHTKGRNHKCWKIFLIQDHYLSILIDILNPKSTATKLRTGTHNCDIIYPSLHFFNFH